MKNNYQDYEKINNWKFGQIESNGEYYENEISRCKIPQNAKILEVGFGNGGFLKWCTEKKFKVFGTEVNPNLVELGRSHGFSVTMTESIENINDDNFNLVAAFDVLEHLSNEQIGIFFQECKRLLSNQGQIIIRVPNGISPFSMQLQNADHTHINYLTHKKIEAIAYPYNFYVSYFGNAHRPLNWGKRSKISRIILYFFRDIFEVLVGFLYFGGRVPLDPNITVILSKR